MSLQERKILPEQFVSGESIAAEKRGSGLKLPLLDMLAPFVNL